MSDKAFELMENFTGDLRIFGTYENLTEISSLSVRELDHNHHHYPQNQWVFYLPYCSFGDYDNSCDIERHNYRVVTEQFEENQPDWLIFTYGGYGHHGILIAPALMTDEESLDWLEETLDSLESYPLLDEDSLYETQDQLITEFCEYCDYDFNRMIESAMNKVLENLGHDNVSSDSNDVERTDENGLSNVNLFYMLINENDGVYFEGDAPIFDFDEAADKLAEILLDYQEFRDAIDKAIASLNQS